MKDQNMNPSKLPNVKPPRDHTILTMKPTNTDKHYPGMLEKDREDALDRTVTAIVRTVTAILAVIAFCSGYWVYYYLEFGNALP